MPPEQTRRRFLGAVAASIVVSSCSRRAASDASVTTDAEGASADPYALVALFDATGSALRAGAEQRLPYAVGSESGVLLRSPPDAITMTVTSLGRQRDWVVPVTRHRSSSGRDYYPLSFTPPAPGRYEVRAQLDGGRASGTFAVPDDAIVPQVGDRLPAIATPTIAAPRGVSPLCTRTPPCPFHEIDLADALARSLPTVLLVASPGNCLSGSCDDVNGLLLARQAEVGSQMAIIHVEVYKNPDEVANLVAAERIELVDLFGLAFEPCLFVVDEAGMVGARLDSIFDDTELLAAMSIIT